MRWQFCDLMAKIAIEECAQSVLQFYHNWKFILRARVGFSILQDGCYEQTERFWQVSHHMSLSTLNNTLKAGLTAALAIIKVLQVP